MKALNDFLRPEFISRVDEVIYFAPLTSDDFIRIAELMLNELVEPLKERDIDFPDARGVSNLGKEGLWRKTGARDLRGTIRRQVEDPIASILVDNCDSPPRKITVLADGECSVRIEHSS